MENIKTIYCDTNIYINCIRDDVSLTGRPTGKLAYRLFNKVASCKYNITISDWVATELNKKVEASEVRFLFALIEKKITRKVIRTEEDEQRAKEIWPEHFQDALHVVLAIKAGADTFVTRDFELRKKLGHLIDIKLPEELV